VVPPLAIVQIRIPFPHDQVLIVWRSILALLGRPLCRLSRDHDRSHAVVAARAFWLDALVILNIRLEGNLRRESLTLLLRQQLL
jgi:hypothetical protein